MQIVYSVVIYFTKNNLKADCAYNLHTWIQILLSVVTSSISRFVNLAPEHVGRTFTKTIGSYSQMII